jgi:hypothetical protein
MTRLERIAEIEGLARSRALSDTELDEFARLEKWREVRLHRLPGRIAACEAKLARLRQDMAALL